MQTYVAMFRVATLTCPVRGLSKGCLPAQTKVTDLRKQMDELRTQLQRNEEMVRWLNNQARVPTAPRLASRLLWYPCRRSELAPQG